MLNICPARSALLPLGALVIATALSACGRDSHPSAGTGSADVSVQALGAVPLGQVTLAISGPPLSTPKAVTLSPQGSGGTYGALISSLPVGSNYLFTVTATDTNNVVAYRGQAKNVAILRNHVTTVVITAQADNPAGPFVNTVPIIRVTGRVRPPTSRQGKASARRSRPRTSMPATPSLSPGRPTPRLADFPRSPPLPPPRPGRRLPPRVT